MAKGNKTAKKAGKGGSKEILSVGSKMKDVVKAAGCMSSGDLIEALSQGARHLVVGDRARQGQRPLDRSSVRPVKSDSRAVAERPPSSADGRLLLCTISAITPLRRSAIEKREILFHQLVERHRPPQLEHFCGGGVRRRPPSRSSLTSMSRSPSSSAGGARVGRVERLDLLPLEQVGDQVRLVDERDRHPSVVQPLAGGRRARSRSTSHAVGADAAELAQRAARRRPSCSSARRRSRRAARRRARRWCGALLDGAPAGTGARRGEGAGTAQRAARSAGVTSFEGEGEQRAACAQISVVGAH